MRGGQPYPAEMTRAYFSIDEQDLGPVGIQDDLMSAFYILLELLNFGLPWRAVNNKKMLEMKTAIDDWMIEQ